MAEVMDVLIPALVLGFFMACLLGIFWMGLHR